MSLFPKEDILTKEIESCKSFGDILSSKEDRDLFEKMLYDCYKYAAAINAKGQAFPAEPLIMALLLSQHIKWLTAYQNRFQSISRLLIIIKELRNLKKRNKNQWENLRDYIRKNDGRIHYIDD